MKNGSTRLPRLIVLVLLIGLVAYFATLFIASYSSHNSQLASLLLT